MTDKLNYIVADLGRRVTSLEEITRSVDSLNRSIKEIEKHILKSGEFQPKFKRGDIVESNYGSDGFRGSGIITLVFPRTELPDGSGNPFSHVAYRVSSGFSSDIFSENSLKLAPQTFCKKLKDIFNVKN